MKYVGVRNKGAKTQSTKRKLPSKSRSETSSKSIKSDKKSRPTPPKLVKKEKHKEKSSKPSEAKALIDNELSLSVLKEPLNDDWFNKCKAEMKPHKHARVALKALHQAGQEKKRIKRIIPDISSAIEKISDIKGSEKSTWKNALWRFVAQFSECDAIQLVKICEQSSKSDKPKKKEKSEEKKPVKDKEQLRREKKEREEKKKRHRDELKRKYELSQKQGSSSSDKRKDERKRKHEDKNRSYKNKQYDTYEKYRRMGDFDPPSAPSMF